MSLSQSTIDEWGAACISFDATSNVDSSEVTFNWEDACKKPLPEIDLEEVLLLGDLPPLPPISPLETEELTKASEQHLHWNNDQWSILDPPEWPVGTWHYEGYINSMSYWVPHIHQHKLTTRGEVINYALRHYYCLRKHLRINLDILEQHGEDILATLPQTQITDSENYATVSTLEDAQNRFAMHHGGISECLLGLGGQWGLPSYEGWRVSRNYFCHEYHTPRGQHESRFREHFKGKTRLYKKLFNFVVAQVKLLEEQLADEDIWQAPKIYYKRAEPATEPEPELIWSQEESQTCEIPVFEEDVAPKEPSAEDLLTQDFTKRYYEDESVRDAVKRVIDTLCAITWDYDTFEAEQEQHEETECWDEGTSVSTAQDEDAAGSGHTGDKEGCNLEQELRSDSVQGAEDGKRCADGEEENAQESDGESEAERDEDQAADEEVFDEAEAATIVIDYLGKLLGPKDALECGSSCGDSAVLDTVC